MNFEFFGIGIQQGLLLAFVAYGVMAPFRLLNLPDLTAEGAYPLGGAVAAALLCAGVAPWLAIASAILMGLLMGLGTGFLHLRFQMHPLLAGIILSTMAYTVNLRLMGKPNLGLFQQSVWMEGFGLMGRIFGLIAILVVLIILLNAFLKTQVGLRLRAVGLNPSFAKRQGIGLEAYTLMGFAMGSALTSLGGALTIQLQRYSDINMGLGMVIHALAALMLGERLVGNQTLFRQLLAPLVGALVYQQIQGIVLWFGLAPTDLKFVTGLILILLTRPKAGLKRALA
jgi:putative ABC transport system permease protein